MATSDEFLVVESKDWIVRVQEIWMEDDLDAIRLIVEQLNASDLSQNRVVVVVRHVVRRNRW